MLRYAANALAFWQGSQQLASGSSGGSAGTVYAVVFLILDASFVIGQFGPFIQTFALAAAAGRNVFALLDHPDAHINVYSDEGSPALRELFRNDIKYHSVSFVYPARPTARVLDAVNLTFRPGTLTGVVGASGSGKSTIAALLLRLYDPSSGKITIQDHDIREYNVSSLRSQIAMVGQDPILFSGTILENIGHGFPHEVLKEMSPDEKKQKCIAAAKEANAWSFIKGLPEGVDTKIGNSGGTQLSGGQKQRVCLARALVSDPALLILDEFTSALDSTSESLVIDALNKDAFRSGRTIIMIAHRLATLKSADHIMVMGQGRLLEEGTHDDLLSMENGAFRALMHAQQLTTEDHSSLEPTPRTSLDEAEAPLSKIRSAVTERKSVADVERQQENDSKSASPLTLISRAFDLSRSEWSLITLGVCASILSGAIVIGESITFGNLINILNSDDDPSEIRSKSNIWCLVFFILALVALCAYTISGTSFGIVSERLIQRSRDISLRTILRQDMEWFSQAKHSPHALVASLTTDSGHLSGLSGVIIGTMFSVATSMIGGIVLAHIVAWRVAVVLLGAIPVMIFAGFLRIRVLARFEQRHQTAYNEAAAFASEACSAISTVASLGRERGVFDEYKNAINKPYKDSIKYAALGNTLLAFALAITYVLLLLCLARLLIQNRYFVYALAYWWGSKQVREGHSTVLQFFIVLPALLFSSQACGQVFSLAPEITRASTAASNVFALHDERPTINSETPPWKISSDSDLDSTTSLRSEKPPTRSLATGGRGRIEFSNVGLTYPTRKKPTFEHLKLSIPPNSFVAFVGPSGAGKSSAISLLERFIDPTSGSVAIDGTDIRTMAVTSHRNRLSLVPQEPSLFSGSITFNVSLGARPGHKATQEEIEEVCKSCGLHDFIMGLPEGYSTECGTNGLQLSGGQRQRIAVARALLRDPDVLLLDEATSALDSHSEAAVKSAIASTGKGRTTVVVAHRLATVQRADCIFVFDHGRVVEQGRHEELIAFGGVYAGLVKAQMLPI